MTHNQRSTTKDTTWLETEWIDKQTLIEIIVAATGKERKQVRDQIRYCQNHSRARYPLPAGDSFKNQTVADWIRNVHPSVAKMLGFRDPITGYLDVEYALLDFDMETISMDEIVKLMRHDARQTRTVSALRQYVDQLEKKLSRWGRPKRDSKPLSEDRKEAE